MKVIKIQDQLFDSNFVRTWLVRTNLITSKLTSYISVSRWYKLFLELVRVCLMKRFQLNRHTNFEIQVYICVFFSHPFSNMFDCWDKIADIFSNNKIYSNFLGDLWTALCGVLESKTTYLQKASDFEKITKLKWSWSFFSYFFRVLYETKKKHWK